jgi:hypothetical protein
MKSKSYVKFISAIILGFYFVRCVYFDTAWHFIDNVNLIFHEAGHPIFSIFGSFVGALGGSLMQILIPLVIVIYFTNQRQPFSAAIVSMWLAQSIVNVSVYMGDAVKMRLPLLGGDSSIHDWNYIFSHLHILSMTDGVSYVIKCIGLVILFFSILMAISYSLHEGSIK